MFSAGKYKGYESANNDIKTLIANGNPKKESQVFSYVTVMPEMQKFQIKNPKIRLNRTTANLNAPHERTGYQTLQPGCHLNLNKT